MNAITAAAMGRPHRIEWPLDEEPATSITQDSVQDDIQGNRIVVDPAEPPHPS
ncbi:hypothetical protein [Agromyces badenianii]|uniref:hypothetical protein n=1 Tax=Agromyces badenianii TaxID=2080742 RepID=UPI0014052860|nr:hypothetical protein [Agromyces badenianii]